MSAANTVAALVRRTKTGVDQYGDDTFGLIVTTYPGVFWPDSSSEASAGRDQVTWQATVCLPPEADVAAAIDLVVPQVLTFDQDGKPALDSSGKPVDPAFEVDGKPIVWPVSPSGFRASFPVEIRLKAVSG